MPDAKTADDRARIEDVRARIEDIRAQLASGQHAGGRRWAWADDPRGAWRDAAERKLGDLEREERFLARRMDASEAHAARRADASVRDLKRQEHDRATRDARREAKRSGEAALWDVYLKAEVALLAVAMDVGDVGPLGDSLLRMASTIVPEWYRRHWLETVYGTTWGREAERTRGRRRSG